MKLKIDTLMLDISIHSLRMEGDSSRSESDRSDFTFQSTPSAWRETDDAFLKETFYNDFNPLPPHGGRRYSRKYARGNAHISIHSLRMEGD